jgi:3'-phosphoadenosine 5'-phosphosulfate sulfotransferase (PAPS reductase)/FAD synthetase
MSQVRHILGISGGKDSAALAIYLNELYPQLDIEYYTSDTGRELDETYKLIDRLESKMGKAIKKLDAVDLNNVADKSPFDHFLSMYGGYLPSSTSRWCTKKLKLEPFETYIGDLPTISYVGIRGDEDRDGYISKKQSVQSIFPFRRNIWSEDVNKLVLSNGNIEKLKLINSEKTDSVYQERLLEYIQKPLSPTFSLKQKLNALLDVSVASYNRLVFEFLKETDYPVGKMEHFPLIDNEENLVLEDIFRILEDSGVGIPAYYKPLEYEVEINGEIKKGTYSRSRSGCFFCFYQQKIEWIWLLEHHPDLFEKAMEYEKDGYSWMDSETLEEIRKPERIANIKKEHYLRMNRNNQAKSWQDQILESDGEGCASCFT